MTTEEIGKEGSSRLQVNDRTSEHKAQVFLLSSDGKFVFVGSLCRSFNVLPPFVPSTVSVCGT